MAWSAPAAGSEFAVSEIVTAAKMNLKITDNLRYLKGLAGGVAIEDKLTVGASTTPAAPLHAIASSGGVIETIRMDNPTNAASNGSSMTWRAGGQVFNAALIQAIRNGASTDFLLQFGASANFGSVDAAVGMTLSSAGLGIGTTAPQGKLHAVGAGGGMLYLSATAVGTTTQTLTGNIVQTGASFVVGDVNNATPGVTAQLVSALKGAGVQWVSGGNSVRIDITAGGAITVKTTGGTDTHQINMLCFYY